MGEVGEECGEQSEELLLQVFNDHLNSTHLSNPMHFNTMVHMDARCKAQISGRV